MIERKRLRLRCVEELFSFKKLIEGWPRRATPTFTLRGSSYSKRKCRGGPPWPPFVNSRNLKEVFKVTLIYGFILLASQVIFLPMIKLTFS